MSNKTEKNREKRLVLSSAAKLTFIVLLAALILSPVVFGSSTYFAFQLPITPTATLPASTVTWYAVAALVILILIAIAVIVYMLAGLIDSPNARAWARSQIYEGILSVIFIIIFLLFIGIFFYSAEGALSSVSLVSPGCSYAYDVFELATCNVASFNQFAFGLFGALYYTTTYLGYTPGFSVSVGYAVGNTKYTGSTGLPSFIPYDIDSALVFAFAALLTLVLVNQVQTLLLSASLLWLGFFVSLGLIARTFGFTRTFGGAMIAMGLGLGLVYPLVTCLTYGFVNTSLFLSNESMPVNIAANLISTILQVVFGQGTTFVGTWIIGFGMGIAGLTFIPFLNFTIVNAFVIDFSKAIGERLDFFSLLIGIV